MGRNDKLLERMKNKPKDFKYDELRRLLGNFHCAEDTAGRTSGSRAAFIHQPTQTILRLHRPHPGNELKAYQIEIVMNFLKTIGVM